MATDKPFTRLLSSLASAAAASGIYLAVKYVLTGGLTSRTLWIAGIIALAFAVISAIPSRSPAPEADSSPPQTDELQGAG